MPFNKGLNRWLMADVKELPGMVGSALSGKQPKVLKGKTPSVSKVKSPSGSYSSKGGSKSGRVTYDQLKAMARNPKDPNSARARQKLNSKGIKW